MSSKKNNKKDEVSTMEVPTTEVSTNQTTTPVVEVTNTNPPAEAEVKPTLGRPINPDSVRQKVLAEKKALRDAGLLKRGRKIVEGSKHQAKLAKRAEKIAAGIPLKAGRPKMTEEQLAKAKAEREALKAAQAAEIAAQTSPPADPAE